MTRLRRDGSGLAPERLLELHAAGCSVRVIAARLGLSTRFVRKSLRTLGLEVTPRLYDGQHTKHQQRSLTPAGITALPFTDEWWVQNNDSFCAGMRRALARAASDEE